MLGSKAGAQAENMMKQYAFRLEFFDRIELRTQGTPALDQLNALGAEGWHIVYIKDDPQHARDLAVFLERETVRV